MRSHVVPALRAVLPALLAAACGGEVALPLQPPAPPPPVDAGAAPSPAPRLAYPATREEPVTEKLHGVIVTDPYRWLEDEKSPEVKAWLAEQDAFARERLAKLPERASMAARLEELFYVESHGVPTKTKKGRVFFSKREAKAEKSVVWVKDGKAPAKVLLDPMKWSADGTISLGTWVPSQDGSKIAYAVKPKNSDEATLHVMDVATQKDLETIDGAKYAHPSWTPQGDGFYYTWIPAPDAVPTAERPGYAEVRFHRLGTDPKKDRTVMDATHDPKTFVSAELSRDGKWLVGEVQHGWTSSDIYLRDATKPPPAGPADRRPLTTHEHDRRMADFVAKGWKPLVVGTPYKYDVTVFRDRLYVRTDDGAPSWHVFRVDPREPARDKWVEIVPARKDAVLDAMSVVGGRLALAYLKDVASQLEIHELVGTLVKTIDLPTVGAASTVYGEPDDDEGYFTFTSFTYPTEIHSIAMKTLKTELFYRLKVPVDPSKFDVEQRFARSKDDTRVPYFVVKPKGFVPDGKAPALVYGYGGFLATQKPGFTSSIFPWIERGGIYVLTNLRGGAEYGEAWHQAGMGRKKQNVFDDLRAVLEALAKDKYTAPDRIAVRGASNGGLLVGAAVTQFPELFRVGLCGVPLIDMLRYHRFGSGKTWISEYGSADDAEDFAALLSYSPYHHVEPGKKYPSVLLLSADADDRVHPLHAWKFAAMLQARSAGGPVLLRIEKDSGHAGADLVRKSVEKLADELAFAWGEMH
jgi:prolyl oligopeptidase